MNFYLKKSIIDDNDISDEVRARKRQEAHELSKVKSLVPTLLDVEQLEVREATTRPSPSTAPTWHVGSPPSVALHSVSNALRGMNANNSFSFSSLVAAQPDNNVNNHSLATMPSDNSSSSNANSSGTTTTQPIQFAAGRAPTTPSPQKSRPYNNEELDLRSFTFHMMKKCCDRKPHRRPSFETILKEFEKFQILYDATYRRFLGHGEPNISFTSEISNSDGYIEDN